MSGKKPTNRRAISHIISFLGLISAILLILGRSLAVAALSDGANPDSTTTTCPTTSYSTTNPDIDDLIAQRMALYCSYTSPTSPDPSTPTTPPANTNPPNPVPTNTPTVNQPRAGGSAGDSVAVQPVASNNSVEPEPQQTAANTAQEVPPDNTTTPTTEQTVPTPSFAADSTGKPAYPVDSQVTLSGTKQPHINPRKLLIIGLVVLLGLLTLLYRKKIFIRTDHGHVEQVPKEEVHEVNVTHTALIGDNAPSPMAHIWADPSSPLASKLVPPLKLISPGTDEIPAQTRATAYIDTSRPVIVMQRQRPMIRSFVPATTSRASF